MARPQIVTGDDCDVEIQLADDESGSEPVVTSAQVAFVKADRSQILFGPYTVPSSGSAFATGRLNFEVPGGDTDNVTERIAVIEVQAVVAGKTRSYVNAPTIEIVPGLIP